MKKNKKQKVIIDTDPGIDDTTALIFTMFDDRLDVQLYTTVKGNINVDIATNNMLHLLEKFGKNTPVAKGMNKGMYRDTPDASWLHGKWGMGETYIPPKAKTKPIKKDAVEAMYEIITANPHEITLILFGPHTNVGNLLKKHPDCAPLIKQIIFEGFSPYGHKGIKPHISFNIRTDPEAFKFVLDSNIPLVVIPSELGRQDGKISESMVNKIGTYNDTGAFLKDIYQNYWEHGYEDKRIATNDTCAYLYLVEPKLFKTKRADIAVNLTNAPGKTTAVFSRKGKYTVAVGLKRKKFEKSFLGKIKALDDIKL